MVTIYNLFDTVGRFLFNHVKVFARVRTAWMPIVARSVFIATYILIAKDADPGWLFRSDWFRVINTVVFGITNGYASSVCMGLGPQLVAADADREFAAFLMYFFLMAGLTSGSLIATFGMSKLFS